MRTDESSRILPPHNVFGHHGPRCPHCSGFGERFVIRKRNGNYRQPLELCACQGTGVDPTVTRLPEFTSILSRIHDLDRQQLSHAEKLRAMSSECRVPSGEMTNQNFQELVAWAPADGVAVANATTEAIIFPNVTLNGGFLARERVLRLTFSGRIGATATPTMTFRLRWGGVAGTVLAQSAAITLAAVTAAIFRIEIEIQTRASGVAGSVFAIGQINWGQTIKTTNTPDMMGSAGATVPAAVTVDLSVDTALAITAQWSAASASNTLTGHNEFLESLN